MKQKFILIIAIVIGIIAAIICRGWIDMKNKEVEELKAKILKRGERVAVIAAARPLAQGTVLSIEDLGIKNVEASSLRNDAIRQEDAEIIIGKRLANSISQNGPLLWSDIEGGKPRQKSFSESIQKGMRAVSIPVSGASAVSGLVRPNDCVDILGSFTLPSANGNPEEAELVTLTILQNVTVLATGTDTFRSLMSNSSRASGYSTITVLVTPREAELLVFTQQIKGRLALSLRNPSDVHFEAELPRVDFNHVEAKLKELNEARQKNIKRR
jgi:pilus assembly protein CpaB